VTEAVSYSLDWRPTTGTWSTISEITSGSYTLIGLTQGTNYEYRVQAHCGAGGNSAMSVVAAFTTLACPTPTALKATNHSSTSVLLNWSPVPLAADYTLDWRPVGSTWATVNSITSAPHPLTELPPAVYPNFRPIWRTGSPRS
jgi:hypothetical protein